MYVDEDVPLQTRIIEYLNELKGYIEEEHAACDLQDEDDCLMLAPDADLHRQYNLLYSDIERLYDLEDKRLGLDPGATAWNSERTGMMQALLSLDGGIEEED